MVIQGIIRPPPEIRAVADRTALYVAKNGRTFEARILNSSKSQTPKFAFLHETSPFHEYYQDRIKFYESGGEDEKEETKDESKKDTQENVSTQKPDTLESKSRKASAIDPIAKALLKQRSKISEFRVAQAKAAKQQQADGEAKPEAAAIDPPPPPALPLVDIVSPASLTVVQIETIQLVAQFVALGSHVNFLEHLTRAEWNNPAFAFCQPRHGHFAYFSALVDAYRSVLNNWTSSPNDDAAIKANNVDACLEAVAYRAEYERDKAERSREETTAAKIDWHDFVVVETIDFAVDEVVAVLPPPPPPQPTRSTTATAPTSMVAAPTDAMNDSDSDDDGEEIRVVPTYTPKIVSAQGTNQMETVIDPITGKSVAVKDMPEHMRIQLLDPRWAEERKRFQEKQKETNLVSGDVVASYLERFAQARGDRFGKKEQSLLKQEADPKKRLEEANRIIREQAQGQTRVGPTIPGQRKDPPPTEEQEPAAKRPKVTYAPSVMQASTTAAAVLPPPPAPSIEDPFASAASGVVPAPVSTNLPANAGTSVIMPEAEFAAALGRPDVTLQIRVPNDPSQMAWNFYGQIVSISVNVMSPVKAVKSELSSTHLNDLPANKIQLKNTATGAFLKDTLTLAALNIGPSATLELVPRARGGKKK